MVAINPIDQQYQYGQYGQSRQLGLLGGLTTPRVTPTSTENAYGISIPQSTGFVDDGNGNRISMGQQGVGLAYVDPNEHKFMGIA